MITRIKTDNILDREVYENDLADGAVTFNKIRGVTGGLPGHVLSTDGFGSLIWTTAAGAPLALDSLTDVDVTTALPAIGDSLAWNGTHWVPQTSISGNPANVSLNNLTDTTLTGPLVQNQFLRYNGFEWVNEKVSVVYVEGIAGVAITGLLNSLTDVNVTGATIDQRLGFDGSQWRAVDPAELSSIDAFSDVDTTGKVDGDALVYDGNTLTWGAVTISGLGASSRTTVVQNVVAMLAQGLKVGDQTYVHDGATVGEWELYLLHTLPGTLIGEWTKIATMDSASTDANTIEAIVVPATVSPVLLGNVSAGSRVTLVTIEVTIAFDFAPTLTVGDSGDNARIIDDTMFDLSEVGTYSCTTDVVYSGVPDTDINGYFTAGGATVGSARILVSYV